MKPSETPVAAKNASIAAEFAKLTARTPSRNSWVMGFAMGVLLVEGVRHCPSSCTPPVREGGLGAGDEFEKRRAAVFVDFAGAQDRRANLVGPRHPLAPAAEIGRQVGVVSAEVARAVLLVAVGHRVRLDRHRRIVEDDR